MSAAVGFGEFKICIAFLAGIDEGVLFSVCGFLDSAALVDQAAKLHIPFAENVGNELCRRLRAAHDFLVVSEAEI